MTRIKLIQLIAFLLVYANANSQSYLNAVKYGTTLNEIGYDICTDASNNIIITGSHQDSITFGSTVLHATNTDAFIVKHNPAGTVLWAKRIAGSATETGLAVRTDALGNIYVAGTYSGNASIDTFNINSTGSVDMFIAKLTSSGNAVWLKSFGSSGPDDIINGIALDNNGNIYLTGEYSGTCQFGNGVTLVSVNHPVNGGSIDAFTAKINNSGIAQWARSGGGIGTDRSYAIDVDGAGNSYITGFISNTATFGGSTLTQNGAVEIFVAGYSSSGTLQLLFKAGSSGYETGYGIALDGLGSFYITGIHNGFTLFDTITATPNGSYDMFLAKYNVLGQVQWVQSTISSQWEQGRSVDVDDKGNPYVGAACYHGGTSMFSEIPMISAGYYDPVIVKYNRHGEFQWAQRGGTTNYDEVMEITVADSGKVYGTGYMGNSNNPLTATFGTFSFPNSGLYDIIFLKLRTDITTGQVNFSTFCAGQAVNVPFLTHTINMAPGNVYTAQLSDKTGRFANAVNIGTLNSAAGSGVINGIIPDTISGGTGYRIRVIASDSLRVGSDNGTNITVNPLPQAVISTPVTDFCPGDSLGLSASTGTGYTYQWLNAFVPITGAMSSVYYATATGVFNVIVSNTFGCNRTSQSVSVTKRTLPAAVITNQGSNIICSGSSTLLSANTGTNYTYKWKKGANYIANAIASNYTAVTGGTYKCEVYNQYGCSRTSNKIIISVSPAPTSTITPLSSTTFCAGDSVVLQANSLPGYTYAWKKYSNFIAGATSQTYVAKNSGNYKVVVANANGCTKISSAVVVNVNCRIASDVVNEQSITITPNPVSDQLNIKVSGKDESCNYKMYNSMGQEVMEFILPASEEINETQFDVSHLPAGIYFLKSLNRDFDKSYTIIKL